MWSRSFTSAESRCTPMASAMDSDSRSGATRAPVRALPTAVDATAGAIVSLVIVIASEQSLELAAELLAVRRDG